MKLRVWHICQIGKVDPFYVDVNSIEEAWKILNVLADYDLFQFENRIKPDYSSANGLEYFDEEENEWLDWSDEDGFDIWEHFREMEEV